MNNIGICLLAHKTIREKNENPATNAMQKKEASELRALVRKRVAQEHKHTTYSKLESKSVHRIGATSTA
jgi:hypothetical protein